MRPKPSQSNWRQSYKWTVTSRKAAAFCAAISPYLRIKNQQAALVIEFMQSYSREPKGCRLLSPALLEQRDRIYAKVIELNDYRALSRRIPPTSPGSLHLK
jgi:hypothetical protein